MKKVCIKILKGVIIMGLMAFLSACSGTPTLDHYKTSQPPLDLKAYFTGPIKAWGLVQDRRRHVVRRFDVTMVGTWTNDIGTLEEHFDYYDGETQKRIWTIHKLSDNRYEGTADDIITQAKGAIEGNAMRWAYQMNLDVDNNTYRITFDDWMFLMNDDVLINRSYLKKFGITVAELTLFMQKQIPS
ncbi:MAG: DUF3833 domain-containing protein [Pseudomonadota bacterium]